MKYEQWKEVLSEVNKEILNKDNVIGEIEEALQSEGYAYLKYQEYLPWKKANFDVNHLFEVQEERSFTDEPQNNKLTLLHLAAHFNLGNIANALLEVEKIDVNALGKYGWTPLHGAAENGHIEIVNVLIKKGAGVNAEDNSGQTALHIAAFKCHIDTVKVLIENGADVNAKDKDGYTPLHWAAFKCHIDTAKVLIEKGADLLLEDKNGNTPEDLAWHSSIKNLLKEAEEKQKKLNEEKNKLPQDKDDNKDTTTLPKETEKKQPTSAAKKGVFAGGVVIALGTAVAVALFATGTVAVELTSILIAIAAVTVAALTVGSITYMLSEPSVEQVAGNERKV